MMAAPYRHPVKKKLREGQGIYFNCYENSLDISALGPRDTAWMLSRIPDFRLVLALQSKHAQVKKIAVRGEAIVDY